MKTTAIDLTMRKEIGTGDLLTLVPASATQPAFRPQIKEFNHVPLSPPASFRKAHSLPRHLPDNPARPALIRRGQGPARSFASEVRGHVLRGRAGLLHDGQPYSFGLAGAAGIRGKG